MIGTGIILFLALTEPTYVGFRRMPDAPAMICIGAGAPPDAPGFGDFSDPAELPVDLDDLISGLLAISFNAVTSTRKPLRSSRHTGRTKWLAFVEPARPTFGSRTFAAKWRAKGPPGFG